MTRYAGAVIGMAAVALVVAYLAFGWPVLLVGGPLLVGVAITLLALVLTERPRQVLRERRAALAGDSPWRQAAERGEPSAGGLMSGFFEVSPQATMLPEQRLAPSQDARRTGAR
ncbi:MULTISPECIES: hypothetical protein [Pseudonocardia]|uniref:Uncharacterized protein n=2 Tax=Pseudonocardia TaxID=1847 RepID=A0A1Y2MMF9_PSEAH|nr:MULTISPECIES: hypothetical protein [Pseudonocardia]OSY36444.1 hypothetical protein BG845_05366 [Pseudonocardia autotrophica]TDN74736.1 hypothetical protein C8E95_3866 [Pseudonocardia autotrophica]BBG05511.1 hypothetical protein Pdca_67200 [Pseudonocardia autotrophica]GEC28036.1 hypothetical protein PSA01_50650 [Pseudonocardia saturnea]